jgi:hypothetical protein
MSIIGENRYEVMSSVSVERVEIIEKITQS